MMLSRALAKRAANAATNPLARYMSVVPFHYQNVFETDGPHEFPYRKLTSDYVSTFEVQGKKMLKVEPEALTLLAKEAMHDIAHLLRPKHLQQLSNILKVRQMSSQMSEGA